MTWFTVALFAHIVGALSLFISLALQWLSTLRLRRARTLTQAREWSGLASGVARLAPATGALIVGAGAYMAIVAQSWTAPWLDVSLAAMALMMLLGMGVAGRRLSAIQRASAQATIDGATDSATGSISPALRARLADPTLWVATQLAAAVALGIVFLMTTRPADLVPSIAVVLVSLALGALVGALSLRPRQAAALAAAPVSKSVQ
ncbi:MAG TPA: hypothetical protein VFU60_10130 [Ktedonobacterales bacterium]|nr:hypothetical protein [Ktedonobacterales bacterium]